MGQVCAKNEVGKVTGDAPQPSKIKRGERDLTSSQTGALPKVETKFVAAEINFKTDKGVDKRADDLAAETAAKWCEDNAEWEYTGTWKNERTEEGENATEVSHFEVRKKVAAAATTAADASGDPAPVVAEVEEASAIDGQKPPKEDEKQSFVDEVSAGLAKKVPADRFTTEGQNEDPTAAATGVASEVESSPAKPAAAAAAENASEEAKAADAAEPSAAAQEAEAPAEEEKADNAEGEAAAEQEGPTTEAQEEPTAAAEEAKEASSGADADVAEGLGTQQE